MNHVSTLRYDIKIKVVPPEDYSIDYFMVSPARVRGCRLVFSCPEGRETDYNPVQAKKSYRQMATAINEIIGDNVATVLKNEGLKDKSGEILSGIAVKSDVFLTNEAFIEFGRRLPECVSDVLKTGRAINTL